MSGQLRAISEFQLTEEKKEKNKKRKWGKEMLRVKKKEMCEIL